MNILDRVPAHMLAQYQLVDELSKIENMSDEQHAQYERCLHNIWDDYAIRECAFVEGFQKGLEKSENKRQELEREIEEKKQTEAIKKFLLLGISTSDIANSYNIDEISVLEIQKSMGVDGNLKFQGDD